MSRLPAGVLGAALLLAGTGAAADHPGSPHATAMSPLGLGLLWGGLALGAGLLVVVIVMLLARNRSE